MSHRNYSKMLTDNALNAVYTAHVASESRQPDDLLVYRGLSGLFTSIYTRETALLSLVCG